MSTSVESLKPSRLPVSGRTPRSKLRGITVLGTGGMGREAAAWVADVGRGAELLGFLDDDVSSHGTGVGELSVLGGSDWLASHLDVEVVLGIGSPISRAAAADRLGAMGITLATVIHPTAVVGPRVSVGPGSIICPRALLTCEVTVGRAVIVNYGAMIGHDGVLGDACTVAPGAHLGGNVTVGAQADVGIGATVIQGVHIGERAVVGAGAVVIRDVPPDTTVVGVPAKALPHDRG